MTGIEQVDTLQDGVNNLVSGQVGKGGLLQPIGDMASKEGINRAERGGKDDKGSYGGAVGDSVVSGASTVGSGANDAASSVGSGAQNAGSGIMGGAKSAGGYVSSFLGGSKKEGEAGEKK